MALTASHEFQLQRLTSALSGRAAARALARLRPARETRAHGRRAYLMLSRADAQCLTVAFMRFVELHGRTLLLPKDRCRMRMVTCPAGDSVMLDLWSKRAAEAFDGFWPAYRRCFGPEHAAEAARVRASAPAA